MFAKIEEAVKDFMDGRALILTDDTSPDGEGFLIGPAEPCTEEMLNFMARQGGGLLSVALTEERFEALGFQQDGRNSVSLDALETGKGADIEERLQTIRELLKEGGTWKDFRVPGHVMVMKTVKGGVLRKAAPGEAAADMAVLAGWKPAGILCDILDDAGKVAKLSNLQALSEKFGLKMITIEDLIAYRRERECYVTKEAEAKLPTAYGEFRMAGFVNRLNGEHHVALVKGEISPEDEVLVRVHSECLTGDAFHSLKCDCGEQLAAALTAIEKEGKGILLYLRQEGRGIGLINKIKAYRLQEQGMDTEEANLALGFPADLRDYGIGAQILSGLNVRKIRLMTNNPKKIIGIRGHGIEVVERVPLVIEANRYNQRYFDTKKEKMGHLY